MTVHREAQERSIGHKGPAGANRFDPVLVGEFPSSLQARVGPHRAHSYTVTVLATGADQRNPQASAEKSVPLRQRIERRILEEIELEGVDLAQDQIGQWLAKAEIPALVPGARPHHESVLPVALIAPGRQRPIILIVGT